MSAPEAIEEEWLRNFLIPKILENGTLISNYSKEKSFNVRNISVNYIGVAEAFMLTKCYRATIDFEYDGADYSRFLVVKKTPTVPKPMYDAIGFDNLFKNEINGYTTIIPTFKELIGKAQQSSKGDEENSYDSFPKYYYSDIQESNAVIVLGDFSAEGWRMTKSRVNLSLEHVLLAVKYLGHFHGLGYALKHTDRKKFDSLVEPLCEARYANAPPEQYVAMVNAGIHRAIQCGKANPQIPSEYTDKLEVMLLESFKYAKKRVQPIEPYANLCHSDYLRNNVAYKYADEQDSEKPTDIMMFDLQTLRYASPLHDLVTFLSLSSGKDVRSPHFDEIFTAYWNSLVTVFTAQTNISIDVLPEFLRKESLLKEYVRYLPFGILIAGSFLMELFEPVTIPMEELLNSGQFENPEFVEKFFTRGGETVNAELSALVLQLYELSVQEKVDVFDF